MIKKDYHIHTTFSDGKNTPEEMAIYAIENGLSEIGFSDHSYTFFDESYCIKKEKIEEYKQEIKRLKDKYKDKIKIFLGIEQDLYSLQPICDYDYVIGSCHYLRINGEYFPIDNSYEKLMNYLNKYFNGDVKKLISCYFDTFSKVVEKTNCTFIGHFDLISKYNYKHPFFDENSSFYIDESKKAVDKLLKYNIPFEINTGGISRGHKIDTYPSLRICEYIKSKGGKFILSSDSHIKNTICYDFDKYKSFIE